MFVSFVFSAHIPLFLYPFLHTVSKTRPFEYLRLTSLGVIGALVKVCRILKTRSWWHNLAFMDILEALDPTVCMVMINPSGSLIKQFVFICCVFLILDDITFTYMSLKAPRTIFRQKYTPSENDVCVSWIILDTWWCTFGLLQTDEQEVITFLLTTEIIPLCLRIMESGSELSKTVRKWCIHLHYMAHNIILEPSIFFTNFIFICFILHMNYGFK